MSGAVDQGLDLNPTTDIERTDPLRRVDLVTRDGEKVHAELVDIGPYLADRLSSVRMQGNVLLAGDLRDFGDRLDRADLVVRVHDADQKCVLGDRLADVVGIDKAAPVDWNVGHVRAKSLEKPAWCQDRGMLDLRRDNVRRSIAARKEQALEREIVGLAATTGEDDLIGGAAEECRNLAARDLQGGLRWHACPMATRRIAVASSRNGRMTAATAGSIGVLAL